jgi:DNA polymerase III epsilon subunit-like protein
MDAICKRYGIKRIKKHRAVDDAKAIYECFQKMFYKYGFTLAKVASVYQNGTRKG